MKKSCLISAFLSALVLASGALQCQQLTVQTDAAEALRMGLVNRVFPQETFLEKAQEPAQELASTVSPRSLRIIKRQVYEALSQPLAEAFDVSVREMMARFRTEDFKEGVAHYVEKRPAAFTGQ